ncbi:peroxiredoxin family protein [Thalassoglobus polymorphus]|uniref:Thioredoxin-dependent thiol peroxidase n=1 Tax=Thalassoglobus polymorphus TaxID=2527994 RepID=A0A517QSI3_9PLAN|nr:peroxiredoxin family protein [Thalassoglobus polymorphus]QDT34573.1 thioredoxin-dependent thiol peroxidase [Thalassoglobus polymorphus]
MKTVRNPFLIAILCLIGAMATSTFAADAKSPPKKGETVPDFELNELYSGKTVSLKGKLAEGPVVLVVLRGFPGKQCPACTQQVGGLLQNADAISAAGAQVVMVYPGLGKDLEQRAREFFEKHKLPKGFIVVTDPDYAFTNKYNLRWDAPNETAYPSTFVVGKEGKVKHVHTSKTHGNRTNPKEIVKALNES